MGDKTDKLPSKSNRTEVDAFLRKVAKTSALNPSGKRGRDNRLIFAMDATASRGPSWERACHIQGEMFSATAALGGLDIQLVYYRGYGEFEVSPWYSQSSGLLTAMTSVFCRGGITQIEKVLHHAIAEGKRERVNAVVFVGDCMEENVDRLCKLAGELGLLGVPVFIFQEGRDPLAAMTFQQIANLSQGFYCAFDANSAQQLRDLLGAVAVYAAGGRQALDNFSKGKGDAIKQLIHQLR